MGSPLGTRANMEMQRFCDGTGSVGVKESFIGGFRWIWRYILRKPPLCSDPATCSRIACYLLLSEAIACARHGSRDKGDIIVKQSGIQKAVEPVPSRTHGHRIA